MVMTNTVISFKNAKKKIEEERLAAVHKELQQQDWFLDNTEVRLKKNRDYIILLFIIDCLIGLVAIMA